MKEIMMDMSMVVGVDSVEMDHAINALPFLRHGDGDRETLEQEQDEYMAVPGITLVQAPQLIAKAEADGNAPVDFTICVGKSHLVCRNPMTTKYGGGTEGCNARYDVAEASRACEHAGQFPR